MATNSTTAITTHGGTPMTTTTNSTTATPKPKAAAKPRTTRSRKAAPVPQLTKTEVRVKQMSEPGRAQDGIPRYGFVVSVGDDILKNSAHQYKTAESAQAAGERWLASRPQQLAS